MIVTQAMAHSKSALLLGEELAYLTTGVFLAHVSIQRHALAGHLEQGVTTGCVFFLEGTYGHLCARIPI